MNIAFCLLMALACFVQANATQQKHIVVIIPSYNNAQRFLPNLKSVLMQDYDNYDVVYIDDCSSDGTGNLVEEFVRKHNLGNRFRLIKNPVRCGASRNIYHAIHTYCPDDAIIVILDGDDEFAQKRSLAIINEAYQNPNVWLTYGDHRMTDGRGGRTAPIPDHIIKKNQYRKIEWRMTHPRTYYAWLYKLIKLEDLLHEGAFFPMAQDLAKMYPMIEMTGGRFKRIQDVLYTYYTHTGIHHFKLHSKQQVGLASLIRSRKPYPPLQQPALRSLTYAAPFSWCLILFSNHEQRSCLAQLQQLMPTMTGLSHVYVYGPDYAQQMTHIAGIPVTMTPKKESLHAQLSSLMHHPSLAQDYCCVANDALFAMRADIAQSVRLLRQTDACVAAHGYYKKNKRQNLQHTTYLQDNVFVFQLGWKPTLFFGYDDYMHVFVTATLKKLLADTNALFNDNIALLVQPQKSSRNKSGLLLVTP